MANRSPRDGTTRSTYCASKPPKTDQLAAASFRGGLPAYQQYQRQQAINKAIAEGRNGDRVVTEVLIAQLPADADEVQRLVEVDVAKARARAYNSTRDGM